MTGDEIYNKVKFIINKWRKVSKGNGSEFQKVLLVEMGIYQKSENQSKWVVQMLAHKIPHIRKNLIYGIDKWGIGNTIWLHII